VSLTAYRPTKPSAKAGRPPTCKCGSPQWERRVTGSIRCKLCSGVPGVKRAKEVEAYMLSEERKKLADLMTVKLREGTPLPEDLVLPPGTKIEFIPKKEDELGLYIAEGFEDAKRVPPEAMPTIEDPAPMPVITEVTWVPDKGDFISLKGKAYLPARRRIQWMRAVHPDWTIATEILSFDKSIPGASASAARKGGFVVMKATVSDETGRIIGQGTKTEYSENFPDYLEKAETGAIARALAVCGYGTEMALDLDEGLEKERIADAPVEMPTIGKSTAPGIGKGGRSDGVTFAQLAAISRHSVSLKLGIEGLAAVIEATLGKAVVLDSKVMTLSGEAVAMREWLKTLTADEAGKVITVLSASAEAAKSE